MSSYSERDPYSQASDWLFGTVRRNPEALLLMAAGCCLMMRRSPSRMGARPAHLREEREYAAGRAPSEVRGGSASARETFSRASEAASDTATSAGNYASQVKDRIADTASDYASQVKDRISDSASSYAGSVRDLAGDARRAVTEHSTRLSRQTQATLQSSMQRVLREQPLAVAVAGLAAGAAVAALFPSSEVEDRVLGGAHGKLKDAAGEIGDRVMGAAGKAGERLKSAMEERGLTSHGVKEVAGEVVDTFKDAVSGESGNRSGAGQSGGTAAIGSKQGFGMEQNAQATPGSPTPQQPGRGSMR